MSNFWIDFIKKFYHQPHHPPPPPHPDECPPPNEEPELNHHEELYELECDEDELLDELYIGVRFLVL